MGRKLSTGLGMALTLAFGLAAAPATAADAPPHVLPLAGGQSVSATLRISPGGEARIRSGDRTARIRGVRRVRIVASREEGRTVVSANTRVLLRGGGSAVSVRALRGRASFNERMTGPVRDGSVRLAHRLSVIRAITPRGRRYFGTGSDGVVRFRRGWTIGFVPGALWRLAGDLRSGLLARWALEETLAIAGHTEEDDHDRGFVYGRSAGAGLQLACVRGSLFGAGPTACRDMRRLVVRAAAQLDSMASRNPAGVIPTSYRVCRTCRAGELDVIVDSLVNLNVLLQAAAFTGQSRFRDTALRHALWVRDQHVRPDGSTFQSVHIDRATGRVLRRETHQGLRETSTWTRGQAWAIYGFTMAAEGLDDPRLLKAARESAELWMRRLPGGGIPRYDFDAPLGAPSDSTAGAIAAAGFKRLARLCSSANACDAGRFERYGARLAGSHATLIGRGAALGRMDRGAYVVRRGDPAWDDRAELAFGLDFMAEALAGPLPVP